MPKPLPGTLKWVLDGTEFSSWVHGSTQPIFHIRGKPGSGKSVLSKFLWDHYQAAKPWTASAYFNCSMTENRRSPRQIYASLLQQLMQDFPALLQWTAKTFQDELDNSADEQTLADIFGQSLARFKANLPFLSSMLLMSVRVIHTTFSPLCGSLRPLLLLAE
jgi:hypothetical protein